MSFTEIPILDLSLARADGTKQEFLTSLRDALLNVGFLYLKNTGIEQSLYDEVCKEAISFFDLPEEEKLKIEMKNQPSFLGYSRVSLPIFQSSHVVIRGHTLMLIRSPPCSWVTRSQPTRPTGGSS